MDRMIRGAYTGRLHPGRTSSRIDPARPSSPVSINRAPAASSRTIYEDEFLDIEPTTAPLVRIHSECYTGETAWSARCDCGEQLDEAARLMSLPHPPSDTTPGGVIIYLRQEGRGIGLSEKLKAYNLQDLGSDTVEANLLLRHPADARSYGLATAMLVDLGLGGERGIRLLTNNPDKVRAVEGPGREVVVKERAGMIPLAWRTGGRQGVRGKEIEGYLATKVRFILLVRTRYLLVYRANTSFADRENGSYNRITHPYTLTRLIIYPLHRICRQRRRFSGGRPVCWVYKISLISFTNSVVYRPRMAP